MQGPSWSTIDFGGHQRLSHHFVRRSYQPLMLWGHLDKAAETVTVHLISDLMGPVAGRAQLQGIACSLVGLTRSDLKTTLC